MTFSNQIDVKPDERILILRGQGESNVTEKYAHLVKNMSNILHAKQLTKNEFAQFIKRYESWIMGQPIKIMHWECQDRAQNGGYIYSFDKEKRILESRGQK